MEKTDLHNNWHDEQCVSHFPRYDKSASNSWTVLRISRQTTGRFLLVAFAVILVFMLYGCKKKSDDGSGIYSVTFYWTPAGSSTQQGPLVESYKFKCNDNTSVPGCNIIYFLDEPHTSGSGEWMAFPKNQSTCSEFVAEVKDPSGAHFTFYGYLMEPLQPDGLRASGNYDKNISGSSESGTFTAYSELIKGGEGYCN